MLKPVHLSGVPALLKVVHLSGAHEGGAERQLLALLSESRNSGDQNIDHRVVLVREGSLADSFRAVVPTVTLAKEKMVDYRFLRDLRRCILNADADIVHAWAPTPNLWAPLVSATIPAGHRPASIMAEVGLDEWKGPILRTADRLAYRAATSIIGCAQAVTNAAISRGADPAKCATIYLGVDVVQRPNRDPEPGLVTLLARFDFRKGHEYLLALWPSVIKRVPHARLVFAGPASTKDEQDVRATVERAIAKNDSLAQTVQIRGRVDARAQLATTSVLAVPSTSEGLPNVILEAFEQRVPVVANDVGGVRELVAQRQGGWCVPPDDPEAFGDALVAALTDTEEAQSRADLGRDRVEQMTLSQSLGEWEKLYHQLHAGGPHVR